MRFLFLKLFLFLSLSFFAQGWRKLFNLPNTSNNAAKTIYETTPGNYIALGSVLDTTNGGYSNKLCVMGLGPQGQLLWTKKYGNPNLFYYDNTFITRWGYKRGNYIFYTCAAQKDTFARTVGVLVKLNLNGDTLWQKTYRDSTEDFVAQRVTGSVDGGLLITGWFQDWTTGANIFLLLKTDSDGNELWRRKIHKAFPDVTDGKGILQDSASKKIVVVGYQYIGNTNSWRSYQNIMILDSLGNQPIRVQNVPLGAGLTDIIQTKDKKFVAVGAKTFSVDGYGDDVTHTYAVKFDINNPASPIWTKEGNSHAYGEYDCITELPDSSFLMGGDMDTVADHQITRIDKRDKNGNLLRSNFYDNSYQPITVSNEQFILCLNPTSDGGHVAAILNLNSSNNPYLFIKYDSSGCDSTLAYCAMLADGIRTLRLSGSLVSVYPNPCKSQLNIDLQNIEAAHSYNGSFYDVSGREAKLIKLEQATNKIDISELEDGLYLLKIENPATKMNYQIKVLKQN